MKRARNGTKFASSRNDDGSHIILDVLLEPTQAEEPSEQEQQALQVDPGEA